MQIIPYSLRNTYKMKHVLNLFNNINNILYLNHFSLSRVDHLNRSGETTFVHLHHLFSDFQICHLPIIWIYHPSKDIHCQLQEFFNIIIEWYNNADTATRVMGVKESKCDNLLEPIARIFLKRFIFAPPEPTLRNLIDQNLLHCCLEKPQREVDLTRITVNSCTGIFR